MRSVQLIFANDGSENFIVQRIKEKPRNPNIKEFEAQSLFLLRGFAGNAGPQLTYKYLREIVRTVLTDRNSDRRFFPRRIHNVVKVRW